jgi:excisionase family DNA binding protein
MITNQAHQQEATSHILAVRSNPPRNMSIIEAAAYMGFSPRKLRYEIAEGRIKAVRFGRRVILRLKDLDDALDQNAY